MLDYFLTSQRSPVHHLKFGYKNINSVNFSFKHIFDSFLEYLCFLIFITGGLIHFLKVAVSRISTFWNPICMPGNCSTYNLFYVAVWSLNEALTFHLLSLYQFLFFLNWFDFLKVLFFLSFFFSFLWLNQSPCFSSHTTCFSHFFDEVRSQSPWFLIFQLWFKLKYTGTHLHWVHWVFAATFTLSEVFVFF